MKVPQSNVAYSLGVARKYLKNAVKDTEKNPFNYKDDEIIRLKRELRNVNARIANERLFEKNGFGQYQTEPDPLHDHPIQNVDGNVEYYDPESEVNISDSESGGDDGVRGESQQPEESRQPKRSWVAKVLHKAWSLVSI